MYPTTLAIRLLLAAASALYQFIVQCIKSQVALPATRKLAPSAATLVGESTAKPRQRLAAAKSWAYWLQDITIEKAAATPVDVLVVDYSRDGSDATALSPAQVALLKQKPDGGRRFVGCYLSIGEAEDYRSYWKASWRGRGRPAWIRGENKDWPGNYLVDFWNGDWQSLIMGSASAYLDKIIAQGFDAVYLDRVDVYDELKQQRPDAEQDMVAFVAKLSAYAKARNPNFGVIMQNAEELIGHSQLAAAIDAIAKEDLLYGLARDGARNRSSEIAGSREDLDKARLAGIPVFVVEYLKDAGTQATAARELAKAGYIATFAPRDLDRIYDSVMQG